jgi:hypothetical protein
METSEQPAARVEDKKVALRGLLSDRFLHDVAITAVLYGILRLALFPNIPALGRPLRLPFAAYEGSSIVLGALQNPAFLVLAGSGVLALVLDQIPGRRNPFFGRVDWREFPPRTNLILLGICFPMMWKFSTYDVNMLVDQVHAIDRILVVLLWVAMARNPAFAPIWLAVTAVIAEQFGYPSCMHATWADKAVVLYVPLLLWVTFLVSRFRRTSPWLFPALLLCHWASFYVYPAIAKMLLGAHPWSWALDNRVHQLWLGSYVNGWLAGLSDGEAVRVAQQLGRVDIPIQIGTMFTELAPLFILFRRRLAALMILACVAMHLGIFVSSGIFFWEWMIPELVLVAALLGPWSVEPVAGLFRARHRMLSVVLIALALPVFWPYPLGWFDTPYNIVYALEVEDAGGHRYELTPEYMDPFNVQHTQGRYWFTDPRANLATATYGATVDPELFEVLQGLETGASADDLLETYGVSRYDAERTAEFTAYLRTVFSRLNDRDGDKDVVPSFLEAPHHQTATGGASPSEPWVDIVAVRVFARDVYYDGGRLVTRAHVEVLEVEIPLQVVPFESAVHVH